MKALLLCLPLLACTAALADPTDSRNGVMTDRAGRTLYISLWDVPGASRCNAECARDWPPFLAPEDAKDVKGDDVFGPVRRDDGRLQWALRGQPLYYFAGDQTPGQTRGHRRDNVWHVVHAGSDRTPAAAK